MADKEYKIVFQGGVGEIEEKKSRFIATVLPVKSEEEAAEAIGKLRKQYWDARHNCHAYIIGNQKITRCSDDGEPSGTAGRPILEVLEGAGIHDVLVVVTRYFGGTLLGTGGLVRAYSAAAQKGLEASTIATIRFGRQLRISMDYNDVGRLQHLVAERDVVAVDTLYTQRVEMQLLVPEEELEAFGKAVTEATAGRAEIVIECKVEYAAEDGKVIYRKETGDGLV